MASPNRNYESARMQLPAYIEVHSAIIESRSYPQNNFFLGQIQSIITESDTSLVVVDTPSSVHSNGQPGSLLRLT
jgi:hypothetical protein